ncbi:MAG: hypothetical protein OZSIB_2349 [Candidatus Ozemobacter sibiricus]|uniref:Transporter n=1 Tax=Candidatus Ozemobacter sibiricus TaxID=2268124 RepID=A0A367ZUD1_9BACT|nr:MAG: hypothetical protein OZSIB_2349 [Candidatus Ozemobacter sibiricus]
MKNKLLIFGLAACSAFLTTGWTRDYLQSGTQAQLRSSGFSDGFIARASKRTADPYRISAEGTTIYAQQDALPAPPPDGGSGDSSSNGGAGGSSSDPILPPVPASGDPGTPSPAGNGGDGGALPPLAPPPLPSPPAVQPTAEAPPSPAAAPAKNGKSSAKAKSAAKSSGGTSAKKSTSKKASGKKRSSAPIVSSGGYPPALPSFPPPYGAAPTYGGGQEIYSQDPLQLPPVSSLPEPSRVTLPPITRDAMMTAPLGEAVSRVLAANFMGLTGLLVTTSADVSREGSFKCGFHSSWFTLDRVYDRVLASGESGDLLEIPLFFNYAVTNDLEFAVSLPILNYTIKSRILWSKDFRESGTGDAKLAFKYRVFDNPQYQMRGAFGLGFKFPTGSDQKGLGTGKTDFEVYTAFSKNFERLIGHLNLGYVMTGDPNTQFYPDGLADIFYYNIGLEYPHNHNVTVMTEVNGQDWGAEGLRIDVTPGLRYTPTENFAFEVGVPIAVTNDQRYGYNYRLVFGVTAFFK